MFIIVFLKTKISGLEKLYSCVNARTHALVYRAWETALLQLKDKFWREFVMNACVASFSMKRYNSSMLMEISFLQLTFKRETKLSMISSEIIIQSRFREKSRQ